MTAKRRVIITISVPEEKRHILERFNGLVRLERLRGGRSELTIRAWQEYIDHHWPGNLQRQLTLPPSSADPRRDRAAINFLRHQIRLPIRQICKIVRRSKPYVLDACGPSGFRGVRVNGKTLRIYRERFEAWMDGRYGSLQEAFRVA